MDLTTLYPTIMRGCNMGFESMQVTSQGTPESHNITEDPTITWNEGGVTFAYMHTQVSFASNVCANVSSVVHYLVEQRARIKQERSVQSLTTGGH